MTESHTVEWKRSWRDEYLKWLCGFANAQGGVLEIGRDDDGTVVGLANVRDLLDELPNKVVNMLGVMADVDLATEDGKDYLRITMDPYPHPVSLRGKYYYRSGSTMQTLTGPALDRFLLSKTGQRWDAVPVPRVGVDDLDTEAVADFRSRAIKSGRLRRTQLPWDDAEVIDLLRLMAGDQLKRAAVLLFHPDPEQYVSGASIKIGYFGNDGEVRYQDVISGNLFVQVDKTMDLLLTKYLKAGISYEGVQRVETLPVPEVALRETLMNAVAHKDYGSGAPIQIRVYADRVVFWNNGQLPENWTVDRLLIRHPSQPYNPDIANVLFNAGMIESWGQGIEKVLHACREHGIPEPSLRYESIGLEVEFAWTAQPESGKSRQADDSQRQSESGSGQPESQLELQLESLAYRILSELEARDMSKKELSLALGQKRVSGHLNKTIKELLQANAVVQTIPDKPTSRLQKYRITDTGRAALKATGTGDT